MIVGEAVRGVTTIAIDTAPLIYFIERHPTYFDCMASVISYLARGALMGIGSMLTLTEVLSHPLKLGRADLAAAYESILLHSPHFRLLPTDAAIARLAAELRARYTLKTPDAIQVATALRGGAQAFLTNDLGLKRVEDLRILIVDTLQPDPIA